METDEYDFIMFEDLINNGLGFDSIVHFDDTDIGLIRHLGCMDIKTNNTDMFPKIFNIRKTIDRLGSYNNKLHILKEKPSGDIYLMLEVKSDGSKKVLVDNYDNLRRAQPDLFR